MTLDLYEHSFNGSETKLAYAEGASNGAAVVLLHGITNRRQTWDAVLPELSHRAHVYAVDMRGHGESGRVPRGYRYTDFAFDLVEFLQQRVVEPAVLVGHSLGALVTALIAANHPGLVRAAVLEDPPLYACEEPLERRRTRFEWVHAVLQARHDIDGLTRVLQNRDGRSIESARERALTLAQCDRDCVDQVMDGSICDEWSSDAVLERIACPTLIIQGDPTNGAALSDEGARRALAKLLRGRLVQLRGVGHNIHNSRPADVVRLVTDVLDQANRDSLCVGNARPRDG